MLRVQSHVNIIIFFRTANHGPSGSSSLPIGRNRACRNQARASSTSSAKCIKQKSSSVRTGPSQSTAGKNSHHQWSSTWPSTCKCVGSEMRRVFAVLAWAGPESSSLSVSFWRGWGMKVWWTSSRRSRCYGRSGQQWSRLKYVSQINVHKFKLICGSDHVWRV